jgi:catalase (peroxidase I)
MIDEGCIDVSNPDNAGIEPAIDVLSPIVNKFAIDGVSRSDMWALAATVGADVTQRSNSRVDMRLKWWGRVDCEKTGKPCTDASGNSVTCSAKKGSHHEFPSTNMHTHDLYSFFSDNFGFNQRDTVAIMGAHTLGVVRPEVGMNCVYSYHEPIQPFTHGCII